MKIQDIVFIVLLSVLYVFHKKHFVIPLALSFFSVSMMLYSRQVFFTASRLVWYGAALVMIYLIGAAKNARTE